MEFSANEQVGLQNIGALHLLYPNSPWVMNDRNCFFTVKLLKFKQWGRLDDRQASEKLRDFVRHFWPSIQIAGTLRNSQTNFQWFSFQLPPTSFFRPVELLDSNVFWVFHTRNGCPIIFDRLISSGLLSCGIAYLLKHWLLKSSRQRWKSWNSKQNSFLNSDFWQGLRRNQQQSIALCRKD